MKLDTNLYIHDIGLNYINLKILLLYENLTNSFTKNIKIVEFSNYKLTVISYVLIKKER